MLESTSRVLPSVDSTGTIMFNSMEDWNINKSYTVL